MTPYTENKKAFFFGSKIETVKNAVITPLSCFYNTFPGNKEKSFFHTKIYNDTAYIKCPQGKPSEDVFINLPNLEIISFLGFCGSRNIHPIGDIVTPNSVSYKEKSIAILNNDNNPFNTGSFQQVDTIEEENFIPLHADFLDMESYSFYNKTNAKHKNLFCIVSDNIFHKPLWKVSSKEKKEIENSMSRLLNYMEKLE